MPRLISLQTEHALCVLVELAIQPEGKPLQAGELSRRAGIAVASAHQVLVRLRRQGFVHSERGPSGGYALARDGDEIEVGEVVAAFEGGGAAARGAAEQLSRVAVRQWAVGAEKALDTLLASETIGGLAERARRLSEAMALMPGL
ncbi:MAG: Rrf2 family transcriptional regulator [Fimbriimonadia bacterium]|jgi:Rrf2 family protein